MQCNMELNEDKSQWHVSTWILTCSRRWERPAHPAGNGTGKWDRGNGAGEWDWGNQTGKSDWKMGKGNLPGISDWEMVLGSLTGNGLSQLPWYPKNSLLSCTMKEFPKKPRIPLACGTQTLSVWMSPSLVFPDTFGLPFFLVQYLQGAGIAPGHQHCPRAPTFPLVPLEGPG